MNPKSSNQFLTFNSLADFSWTMNCGGEVVFCWNGKSYFVGRPCSDEKFFLAEVCVENPSVDEELSFNEVLEFELDGTKIKDLITKAEIIDRTL